MNFEQMIYGVSFYTIIFTFGMWIIVTCIFGMIMKHFIREAIKEALEECGLSKRKTDYTM